MFLKYRNGAKLEEASTEIYSLKRHRFRTVGEYEANFDLFRLVVFCLFVFRFSCCCCCCRLFCLFACFFVWVLQFSSLWLFLILFLSLISFWDRRRTTKKKTRTKKETNRGKQKKQTSKKRGINITKHSGDEFGILHRRQREKK